MDRTLGIGGSDIAAILGFSRYTTPFQLWEEKLGLVPAKEESWAMERGHLLEPGLLRRYEQETGNMVVRRPAQVLVPGSVESYGVQFVISVDGDVPLDARLVEAKTTSDFSRFDKEGNVPEDYQCQADAYMALAHRCFDGPPRRSCDFPIDDVGAFRILTHEFDSWSWDHLILPACRAFARCVATRTAPDPINAEDVLRRHPVNRPGAVAVADDRIIKLWKELMDLLDQQAPVSKRIEALKDELKLFMDDAGELRSPEGHLLATWKSSQVVSDSQVLAMIPQHPEIKKFVETKRKVKVGELSKAMPRIADACRVPGSRSFLPKKPKNP